MAEPQLNSEVSAAIVKYAIAESVLFVLGAVFYVVLESIWPVVATVAAAPVLFGLMVLPVMMRNRSNDRQ
jgi:hypothetical protein